MARVPRQNLFVDRMKGLYGVKEGKLEEIVANRTFYTENPDAKEYEHEREVLRIYDLHKKLEESDPEISDALYATALWYIYQNVEGVDYIFVNVIEDPKTHKQQSVLNYNALCEYLYREYCMVSANGAAYLYIGSQYFEDTKGRLKKTLVKLLKEQGFSDTRKVEPIIRDTLYRVKADTMKFHFPFNQHASSMIPVLNGVVVRRQLNCLLPKSPVWGFTYSLPVKFNPGAPTDRITTFLKQIVNEDDSELLIQVVAQALLQHGNYQLAYLLTGDGANGKSTYLSIITNLVGKENCTAISLQEIVDHRFKIAELQGKLFNIYADLPKTSLKTTGMFKILTGGDDVLVEKKFEAPFKFQNKSVFVFSANELPEVDDGTFAFWRRWNVIEFPYKFPPNPNLSTELSAPDILSGFLNLIIEKMDHIETKGLTRSKKVEAIMEMWKSRSNSAYAFIKAFIEKDPRGYLQKDPLFAEFSKFCDDNDFAEPSKTKFTLEMEKFGAKVEWQTVDRQRVRVFKGVKRKGEDIPKTQPPDEKKETDTGTAISDFAKPEVATKIDEKPEK